MVGEDLGLRGAVDPFDRAERRSESNAGLRMEARKRTRCDGFWRRPDSGRRDDMMPRAAPFVILRDVADRVIHRGAPRWPGVAVDKCVPPATPRDARNACGPYRPPGSANVSCTRVRASGVPKVEPGIRGIHLPIASLHALPKYRRHARSRSASLAARARKPRTRAASPQRRRRSPRAHPASRASRRARPRTGAGHWQHACAKSMISSLTDASPPSWRLALCVRPQAIACSAGLGAPHHRRRESTTTTPSKARIDSGTTPSRARIAVFDTPCQVGIRYTTPSEARIESLDTPSEVRMRPNSPPTYAEINAISPHHPRRESIRPPIDSQSRRSPQIRTTPCEARIGGSRTALD
jgi:hypothetical protein